MIPGTYEYRRGVQVLADGVGSLLDLPAMTSFIDTVSGATGEYSVLDALNGGTILAPNLTRLVGVQLRSRADGTIPIGQITDVTNGTLRVFGTTPDFNRLSNIDRSSLLVQDGGLLRLLGVTSYTHDNGGGISGREVCGGGSWQRLGFVQSDDPRKH